MRSLITALGTGLAVGAVFGFVKLPPPAPSTWAGVLGIVGIVGGWMLVGRYTK